MKCANLESISEFLYGLKQKSGMRGLGWGVLVTGYGANLEAQGGVGVAGLRQLVQGPCTAARVGVHLPSAA